MACIGASDFGEAGEPDESPGELTTESAPGLKLTRPTTPKNRGSQLFFAAATAILPAMNEFPSSEPATTRQINTAAKIPNAYPSRRVMAVFPDKCQR